MERINHQNEPWVVILILIISVIFSAFLGIHGHGDANTYYLMTESLIKDGDLALDNKEIERWDSKRFQNVPVGVYMLVDDKGITKYAKPILYPLIAVPFFFLFGVSGFGILNGLFLGGSIALSYIFLRKHFNRPAALFTAVAFFLCSFMPVYAAWIHPEMMLFFICSLCMWLWVDKNKTALSALIIGITSSIKIVFALLLIPMVIALAFKRNFRELSKAAGMCFLGISAVLFLTVLFFGQFSFDNGAGGFIYSAIKYIIAAQIPPYSGTTGIVPPK